MFEGLELEKVGLFLAIWNTCNTANLYSLFPFGNLVSIWYFFPFWYIVSRKIWQPWKGDGSRVARFFLVVTPKIEKYVCIPN
jgi:hypothetical protein